MMKQLSEQVVHALLAANKTLATAESLTAGMIGGTLAEVPGCSQVYLGGVISYTNGVKHRLLGVPEALLETVGAVSAPVAEAMARGARAATGADLAVAATGLAGPGGDSFGNPVGTVFLALAERDRTEVRECHFSGNRAQIRQASVDSALELVLAALQKTL